MELFVGICMFTVALCSAAIVLSAVDKADEDSE